MKRLEQKSKPQVRKKNAGDSFAGVSDFNRDLYARSRNGMVMQA